MDLSDRLKSFRRAIGYTQKRMGELLHIPQTTYSNYENGSREMPNDVLNGLPQIGLDTHWLLTGRVNQHYHRSMYEVFKGEGEQNILPIAVKLGVPEAFIRALKAGEVGVSEEFFNRIMLDGFGVEPPQPNYWPDSDAAAKEQAKRKYDDGYREELFKKMETEIAALRADLAHQTELTRQLSAYNRLLEEKLSCPSSSSSVPVPAS